MAGMRWRTESTSTARREACIATRWKQERSETSVFTELGAARFTRYLTNTESERNGRQLVNRYAQALWDTRPDFRDIFPNIDGDKGADFVSWLRDTARDTGISTALLPKTAQSDNGQTATPAPKKATRTEAKPGVNIVGYISSSGGLARQHDRCVRRLSPAEYRLRPSILRPTQTRYRQI